MLPKDDLLKGAENIETLTRVIDQADQAIRTWEPVTTDFLSPPELYEAQAIFSRLTDIHTQAQGGYPQAERQRLTMARTEIPLAGQELPLATVQSLINRLQQPGSHLRLA